MKLSAIYILWKGISELKSYNNCNNKFSHSLKKWNDLIYNVYNLYMSEVLPQVSENGEPLSKAQLKKLAKEKEKADRKAAIAAA